MASPVARARRPPRRLRWVVFAVAALLVVGGVVFAKTRPTKVTAATIVRGTAVDAVYATGTVESEDRVDVKAKSAGSIAELLVREGARVKKGDLLARIDNPVTTFELRRGEVDRRAAAAQAGGDAPQIAVLRAQNAALSSDLGVAKQDLARAEELAKSGVTTPADLDRARARVASLEASVAANLAQQRAVRIDLSANVQRQDAAVRTLASRVADTEVRAPLDGVVLSRRVEPGEVVSVNQTLLRIGDTSRLILEVAVDEADVAKVSDGPSGASPSVAAVSLFAFPGRALRGTVFEVFPDANRDRKSFLVKLRLDAPPAGLRSGMSAEVNIVSSERPGVLLIPVEALVDGHAWVVRGGRATRVPVKTGLKDLLRVEVLGGLGDGDVVVVEGHDKLREGARVDVTLRAIDRLQAAPDANQPAKATLR